MRMVQNRNLHVVYDGTKWAIAEEGIGRVASNLELAKAIAIATSLAVARGILIYVHEKDGCIAKRVDFRGPLDLREKNVP